MSPLRLRPLLLSFVVVASGSLLAGEPVVPTTTVPLFNGRDLSGWTTVVRSGDTPDPGTWTVVDGVVRCSGRPNGYIRTDARYRDYRLVVEWRWTGPAPTDAQGNPRNRNSGVLLHTQPPDAVWPRSLEAQLMETNAGDIYVIGGVETAEFVTARDAAVAAAGADEAALKRARGNRRTARAHASSEKPIGEWNTYEITCRGDTVSLRVNGVDQNHATGVTVREGHICLQSEGAALEFRNARLEPL